MNRVRAQYHLSTLRMDRHLTKVARAHTKWMLDHGAFTHGDFARRVTSSGARGPAFGENLAWATGSAERADYIVKMWLESPDHRANLLRRGFRRIGLGELRGAFAGNGNAVVVTADFAGR